MIVFAALSMALPLLLFLFGTILGGYLLGYGFRKGWDRAGREARRQA